MLYAFLFLMVLTEVHGINCGHTQLLHAHWPPTCTCCSGSEKDTMGWHTTSWTDLVHFVPIMMLLVLHKIIYFSRGVWKDGITGH